MWYNDVKISRRGDFVNKKQKIIDEIKAYLFFGVIGLFIIFFFLKPVVTDVLNEYKKDRETITNRELEEFIEWEEKQSEKEWENQETQ